MRSLLHESETELVIDVNEILTTSLLSLSKSGTTDLSDSLGRPRARHILCQWDTREDESPYL